MKNLRKLSKHELKSVLGGIETCDQNCITGYYKCCIPRQKYYCLPLGTKCTSQGGSLDPSQAI